MMDIMTADTSTLPAIGAAIAAVLAALVAYVLPGAFSRFPLKSRSEACFWAWLMYERATRERQEYEKAS